MSLYYVFHMSGLKYEFISHDEKKKLELSWVPILFGAYLFNPLQLKRNSSPVEFLKIKVYRKQECIAWKAA